MNPSRTYTTLALAIAAMTGLSLPVALPVYANPEGATVVSGEASIQQIAPGQLEIRNSAGAIINWHDFSVGEGEATRFIQPSAASAVLNRVVGQNPSQILGQLASNGRVFLINQNGIVFGAGAKIDTAGLVASTLNITDEDFLAGRLQFEGGNGKIDNYGMIQAGPGGEIVLIAPEVTNHGVLSVEGGQLILAAGQKVRLASLNIDDVTVEVRAPTNTALNLGQLIAERGAIGLLGATVTNNGLISATSLSRDAQGRVVLSASGSLGLGKDSAIDVSGVRGGDIRITANDTALVRGSLNATGTTDTGGSIDITAPNTGLFGDVRIDASGATGGGRVRVGGGFQGQSTDIANATHTVVERGARIAANATERGHGGEVVLWADDSMRFMGDISARGGLQSGNGGNVEVSGHERLGFDGTVDVGASAGTGGLSGQILLDPNNGTIVTGSAPSSEAADGVILFGDAAGTDLTISEGALEVLTGNIDLQFQQNLTVNSGVSLNFTNQTDGELVSFRAGGNLTVNGSITTGGADLLLSAGDVGATSPLSTAALAINSATLNVTAIDSPATLTLRNRGSGGISLNAANVVLGGGTLEFDTAGALTTNGSTFSNGLLAATGTTATLTGTATNTFNTIDLDVSYILSNASNLFLSGDMVIGSGRALRLQSTGSAAQLLTNSALTIRGPGALLFEGTSDNNFVRGSGGTVLTLAPDLVIGGTQGASFFSFTTLNNQTNFAANQSGRTIALSATTINNTGTLSASNGGTLTLNRLINQTGGVVSVDTGSTLTLNGTAWSNALGTINLIGGTLNLDGSFTTAQLGNLVRGSGPTLGTAGAVNITGTWDLEGKPFAFNNNTGAFALRGGTIANGTLTKAAGSIGDLTLASSGTFNAITLDMDFNVLNATNLFITGDLNISSGRALRLQSTGSAAQLFTNTALTIRGPGALLFEGTSDNNFVRGSGVSVLTLAPDLVIGGTQGASFFSFTTLNNQTNLAANQSGRTIALSATTINNTGTLSASNGGTLTLNRLINQTGGVVSVDTGSTLTLNGTAWSNALGTINLIGGTLNLDGSFTTAQLGNLVRGSGPTLGTAGAVNITGTWDLEGKPFAFNNNTGAFALRGGTIANGTLTKAAGSIGDLTLASSGTFNAITLDMDFNVLNATNLFITGDLNISSGRALRLQSTGSAAQLFTNTALTIRGPGALLFEGTSDNNFVRGSGVSVLTLAPDLVIGGTQGASFFSFTTLNNQTNLAANQSGRTIALSATTINNTGTLSASNGGTLTLNRLINQTGGVVSVDTGSTLTLNGTAWSNALGTINLIGGTLNLDGSFTTAQLGNLVRGSGPTLGTAGAVNITGTWDLEGKPFAFNNNTGAFALRGGTIANGTLTKAAGSIGDLTLASSGTFNAITLDMDFNVLNATNLFITGDLNISSGRALRLQSTGSAAQLFTNTALTIRGPGALLFEGTSDNNFVRGGSVLTLAPDLVIGGTQGASFFSFTTLNNQTNLAANQSGRTIALSATTINNTGTLSASNGGTLTLNRLINQTGGVVSVDTGSTLTLNGTAWSNALGTINLIGGTLNLDGSFTTAQLGNLVRGSGPTLGTAGAVNITGTWDLEGKPFAFNNNTGVYTLRGGTIANGTLTKAAGSIGDLTLASSGTFNAITLDMDFNVLNATNLFITGDLNISSGRALRLQSTGSAAQLFTNTALTIRGPGALLFEGTSDNNFVRGGSVLTLAPDLVIGGTQGASFFSFTTLNNQTNLAANQSGRTIALSATTINNTGTLSASNGGTLTLNRLINQTGGVVSVDTGSTLTLNGTAWSNALGTINLIGGTLNLDGSFTTAQLGNLVRGSGPTLGTAGTVNITGTWDLGNSVFSFNNNTGAFALRGGTIANGTLTKAAGSIGDLTLANSGTFNAITLDMDFNVLNATNLFITGDLNISSGRALRLQSTGSAAQLFTNTALTIRGPGALLFEGTSDNNFVRGGGGTVLTLAPDLVIGGSQGASFFSFTTLNNQASITVPLLRTLSLSATTLINAGSIALGDGATLALSGPSLSNNGTLNLGASGTVTTANINLTNNGTITGNGRVDLTTDATFEDLINNGTIRPGTSPGLLTIDGDLVLNSSSVLDLEVQGRARARQYDAIDVLGAAQLAGTVNVTHLTPYVPVAGHSFRVLTSTGTRTGTFTTVNTPVPYNTQYVVGNNVLLQVGATPQSVNFWLNNTSGNYSTASNWSLGSAPVAGQIVIIDRAPANITVTVDGAQVTGNLFSTETLSLSSGALGVTDDSLIDLDGTLNIAGGTLSGKGPLGVDGIANFSSGSLNTTLNVSTLGQINLTGTADKAINGGTLNNAGIATFSGTGAISMGNGARLNNLVGGSFAITGRGAIQDTLGGAVSGFNNAGNLTRSVDTVGTTISVAFNNSGAVDLQAGTLALTGNGTDTGSYTSSALTSFQVNGGTRTLTGGSIAGFSLNVNSGSFTLSPSTTYSVEHTNIGGGTLQFDATGSTPALMLGGSGTLSGSGTLTLTGASTWSSGTVSIADLVVTNTGSVALFGAFDKTLSATRIANSGSITLDTDTVLRTGNGAVISNLFGATIAITGNAQINSSLGGTAASLNNAGLVVTAGTGTSALAGITFTNAASGTLRLGSENELLLTGTGSNAGSIEVRSDNTLEVADGFTNTGSLTGSGTVRIGSLGTGTLSNAGTVNPANGANPTATLTINGNVDFTSAGVLAINLTNDPDFASASRLDISGNLTLVSGATLNATLFGGFTPIASDRFTFVNAGSISGSFSGSFPGGLILQNGVTSLLLRLPGGSSCAGTLCFDNSGGDFLWSNPSNWDADRLPDINDDVRIDLSTATLVLFDTGDFTITNLLVTPGNGLRLTGGNLFITGNAAINGLLALAGGSLQLGGISSAAMFDFSSGELGGLGRLTVSGPSSWTGGRSTLADFSFSNSALLSISGSADKILDGGVLNNRGIINLSGTGAVSTGGGAIINNLAGASFVLGNGAQVLFNRPGAVSQFNNAGLLTTEPDAVANLDGLTFSNTGNVTPNGTLAITGAGSNAGEIQLLGLGVRLQVADGFINNPTGLIIGAGSVQVGPGSTGTLINSGALVTATEAGGAQLSVEGNLSFTSTGSLTVSIAGSPTSSAVDRLNVTRALSIDAGATLNTQFSGAPNAGDTYTVVTAGSITGTFTSTPPAGLLLTAGATSISLSLPGGITCAGTICFDNDDGDALWTNPRNWSTNALPGASDDVRIDLGTPVIVLLNSGNFSITQLLITNGNGLRINGGSLLVSGGAVFDGTLELISGLLGGNSFVFNNSFSWSGGTFSGDPGSTATLGDGGSIVFTGSGDRVLTRQNVSIDTVSLPGGSLLVQGSTLTARLRLDILAGATLIQNFGTLSVAGVLNNAGTLRVLGGNLNIEQNGVHSGVFEAARGTNITFVGDQDFADGSRFQGGGVFLWNEADITLSGVGSGLQVSGTGTYLSINDSSIRGAGNLSSATDTTVALSGSNINNTGSLTFAGFFDWVGGSIGSTLNTSGNTTLTGSDTKSLASGVWNNTGTVTWTDGNLNITAGSVFNNQSGGSFVANLVDVDAAMTGSGVFNNLSGAQFTQQAEGESCRIAPTFTNAGLLVLNGDLQILRAFTNNGVLRIASGATLSSDAEFNGSQFGNGASGRVEGNGSIDAASSGVAFSNAGTVAPGASPGRLRILGNYVQTSTGVLDVELNDSTPITGYDVLDITGSAVLGGTLRIRTPDGAVFSPGASFDVLRYGSVSGDFASTEQPARGSLVATVGLTQYSLQLAANNEPFLAPERSVLVMTAPEQLPNALVDLLAPTEDPVQFIARRRGGACN